MSSSTTWDDAITVEQASKLISEINSSKLRVREIAKLVPLVVNHGSHRINIGGAIGLVLEEHIDSQWVRVFPPQPQWVDVPPAAKGVNHVLPDEDE